MVAAFGAVLYGLDYYYKATQKGAVAPCIANLKQLEGAKNSWAVENGKTTNDIPKESELCGPNGYIRQKPQCPQGGTYVIGRVGEAPRCTIPEHSLDIGLVQVMDESGKPVGGAMVAVEAEVYETTIYGTGWANTNQPGARTVIVSKSGYTTERISLPVSWPIKVVLKQDGTANRGGPAIQ